MNDDDKIDFKPKHDDIHNEIDKKLRRKKEVRHSPEDRVRIAHEIKNNPPEPGFMKVDVKPAVYSIDLNIDAHWWFNHVCTVFPLLMDQGIRTHVDVKDSFKPEKRLPDFNYMWIIILIIGLVGIFLGGKFIGLF